MYYFILYFISFILFYFYSAWNTNFVAITQILSATFSLKMVALGASTAVHFSKFVSLWSPASLLALFILHVNHSTSPLWINSLKPSFQHHCYFYTKIPSTTGKSLSSLLGRRSLTVSYTLSHWKTDMFASGSLCL